MRQSGLDIVQVFIRCKFNNLSQATNIEKQMNLYWSIAYVHKAEL